MNKSVENNKQFPLLAAGNQWYREELFDKHMIRKIRIVDCRPEEKPAEGSLFWDVSETKDGSIMAVLTNPGTEIVLSGNGSGRICPNLSMSGMFADFTALEAIDGLNLLDTGDVTDMSYLFYHCSSLKELDLSCWDVSNVNSFRGTFCCGHNQVGDAALEKINITGWNVSNATDMAYMFYGCGRLEQIDVAAWNTAKVTNFRHTFADCFRVREIDTRNWNTESVITFDGIFNDCKRLKVIDVSNWDTSSCREFDQMFDGCSSLRRIKGLNHFKTMNGISFEEMFFGCGRIRHLDLSSFDTRRVDGHEFVAYNSSIKSNSNMEKMLAGCNRLKELKTGCDFTHPVYDQNDYQILKGLKEVGYIVVTPKTGSMKPMLRQQKDQAVFKRKDRYQKNDIVLFKSEFSSSLVMHRIRAVLPQGYVICGDNARCSEFVFRENVFAGAAEIHRQGKVIPGSSITYGLLSGFSIGYNRVCRNYKNNNGLFWKVARKIKRAVF